MLIELIIKGGPIMIPIIVLSIVALAIILERVWTLWRIRLNIPRFAEEVFSALERGQLPKALEHCKRVRHPIGGVFRMGLLNRTLKRDEIEKIMEREGEEQVQYLEYLSGRLVDRFRAEGLYLGALLIIVGVEPMLGFLGTITGLIRAFMRWEHMGPNITVNALAAGIYEAMITTAAGLMVAIPAYVSYHLILGKIRGHAQEISYYGNELIDLLGAAREAGMREGSRP